MPNEYPTIKDFALVGNTVNPLVGSPLASAATISPVRGIHHVTGTAAISNITIPWDGFSGTLFLIADGAWSLDTAGNINAALTASAGNIIALTFDPVANKFFPSLLSASGGSSILPFVADNSGAGDGVITGRKTPSGGSAISNFLNVTGTVPAAASTTSRSAVLSFTTSGTSVQAHQGLYVEYKAGLVSTASAFSLVVSNTVAGQNSGSPISNGGNYGAYITCTGTGSVVYNTGVRSEVSGAGTGNTGVVGLAILATGSPASNVGIAGYALNGVTASVAVLAALKNVVLTPTVSTALLADNGAVAASAMAIFAENGTTRFTIDVGGNYKYDRTITAGGTTGAQTINKAVGTVNFAAAATTLVVTNNLVTTSSIIFCTVRTADATATIKSVVPAAGSFTITLGAAATAETSVGFLVTN